MLSFSIYLGVLINLTLALLFLRQVKYNPGFKYLSIVAILQAVDFMLLVLPREGGWSSITHWITVAIYANFYLYGPLLLFFFERFRQRPIQKQRIHQQQTVNARRVLLHFLPAIIFTLIVISVSLVTDIDQLPEPSATLLNLFSIPIPFAFMSVYIWRILTITKSLEDSFIKAMRWILSILFVFNLSLISVHVMILTGLLSTQWNLVMPVIFSLIEYTLFVKVLWDLPFDRSQQPSQSTMIQTDELPAKTEETARKSEGAVNKLETSLLSAEVRAQYRNQLNQLLTEQQLYLEPGLKLDDVAAAMNLPSHQLSEVINREFDQSFQNLINQYRIDHVKKAINQKHDLNILELAFEAGFGSKTAFNRAFKKSTDLSPSQWKAKQIH